MSVVYPHTSIVRSGLGALSDDDLIALYKETGDRAVIGVFYERYAHLMLGVCMKYLKNESASRDALMQVFEKLYESLRRYEFASFKSWFYSVTKHHCLLILKQRKEYAADEELIVWKSPKEVVEFGDDLTLTGRLKMEDPEKKLQWALDQLIEEQRVCVELFYLEEKSYQEVQEITKFSYMQVKSYIQNGKRNLKNLLSGNHGANI